MTRTAPDWWHPDAHADRRPALLARARIVSAIRAWFTAQGFLEVDPGALQVSPGNEAHLHGFATSAEPYPGGPGHGLYLHTSPEFAMKKLLAAGETRIFSLVHVFRNRERGPLHAPEFTMLEWYRAGAPYEAVIADTLALLGLAAEAAGTRLLRWRERSCNPAAPAERLSVTDAFRIHAGADISGSFTATAGDGAALSAALASKGLTARAGETWSDLFSRALVSLIEPRLGLERPTVLDRYPRIEAALAQGCADDPRLAERFEVYACGVELANGFGELTDPAEQRARFEAEMTEKARVYGERYPIDEDFLAALALMPPASGVALGLDRLVLLATAARQIDDVIWTPLPGTARPEA